MHQYSLAEEILLKANTEAGKYWLSRRMIRVSEALSDLYTESGDEKKALDYYVNYVTIKDAIDRQNTFYLLAELKSKYEAEDDNCKMELLEKENQVKDLDLEKSNTLLISSIGISLLLILFYLTLINSNRLKVAQRETLMHQKLFRARMSPEFLGFSLENIKELVRNSRNEEASAYITYFSRMMQFILEGSRQELMVFSRGMMMLKTYFELMKLSQQGRFEYKITMEDDLDLDKYRVPSFLQEILIPGLKIEPGNRSVEISFAFKNNIINVSVESFGKVADSVGMSREELESLRRIRKMINGMSVGRKVTLSFNIAEIYSIDNRQEGIRLDFDLPAIPVT
jgi:LytS/YehU family sensor histidine kinase